MRHCAAWRCKALSEIFRVFVVKAYSHCTAAIVTLESLADTLSLSLLLLSLCSPLLSLLFVSFISLLAVSFYVVGCLAESVPFFPFFKDLSSFSWLLFVSCLCLSASGGLLHAAAAAAAAAAAGLSLPGLSGGESAAAAASRECLSLLERLQLSAAAAAAPPSLPPQQPTGGTTGAAGGGQQQQQQHQGSPRKSGASFSFLSDGHGGLEGPPGGTPRGSSGGTFRDSRFNSQESMSHGGIRQRGESPGTGHPVFNDSKDLYSLWATLKEESERERTERERKWQREMHALVSPFLCIYDGHRDRRG